MGGEHLYYSDGVKKKHRGRYLVSALGVGCKEGGTKYPLTSSERGGGAPPKGKKRLASEKGP